MSGVGGGGKPARIKFVVTVSIALLCFSLFKREQKERDRRTLNIVRNDSEKGPKVKKKEQKEQRNLRREVYLLYDYITRHM